MHLARLHTLLSRKTHKVLNTWAGDVGGVLMSEHAGSHQRSCDERSEEAARLRAAGKRGRLRMHALCRGLLACALPLA